MMNAPAQRRRPQPRRRRADPAHRRGAALAGRPADQEAARAARPHRGQPVLRGLHPHPDLLRGRGQAALRRRDQLLGQGLLRSARARALKDTALTLEAMGADAVVVRHWRQRRAAPARPRGWVALQRRQRRRRHPRAPDPGAARRLHDVAPPRRVSTAGRSPIVGDILHSRVARSNALLLQHARRRGHPGRAADPAAGRRRGLGRARRRTTSTPCCPRSDVVMMLRVQRERMNAALLPDRARVLPPLRPRLATDGDCCRTTRS